MFRLKFVLAFIVLILAQDTFSKSIKKKHSKKQSIPSQKSHKSHYLLLMGSPVEDEHNRKGLGMVLSSKLREEPDQLKDRPAKGAIHHSNKPDSDLAETLQTSSKVNPSDHGYSYTEALFTGAPLLNGRPFTESDRTQGQKVGHDNGHPVIAHDKPEDGYNNTHADKGVGHTKEDENVQIQKEIHTEEGVSGYAVPMKPKKITQNYDSHQYLIRRPSLNVSPYKSASESLGNKEYTHTHKVAESLSQGHNNIPSFEAAHSHFRHEEDSTENTITDPPAEQVHQILVTGKTQENFVRNGDGNGPLVEEKKSNYKLPDKTYIKSYDEESNLVGSSFYNKGQSEGKQVEFHTNDINEPTDHEKTYGLQTGESFHKPGMDVNSKLGDQNIQSQSEYIPTATVSENSKTDISYEQRGRQPIHQNHVQPLESNVDSASEPENVNEIMASRNPNSRDSYATYVRIKLPIKKANASMTVPTESGRSDKDSRATYATYVAIKSPIKKANASMTVPSESDRSDKDSRATYATYVGIKLPTKNANASMTVPSESDRSDKERLGTVNDVNELRAHKIIESAFDEDLVQRIRLNPLSKQGSHRVPIQQSEDRQAEVGSHTTSDNTISDEKSEEQNWSNMKPPSLPFREGSNPAELSRENEQSNEESSEAARAESLNRNQNEEATQQDTSQQMSSEGAEEARPGNENTAYIDSNSQKEDSENGVAYGPVTNDASSDNSIKSSGDIPNQTEAYGEMKFSSSYQEGSNPQTFGHQKEEPASNGEKQPVEASSSAAEAAKGAPSGGSQMKATRQQDSSNEISSTDAIDGASSNQDQQHVEQETETNSGASEKSSQREASQEISSSSSYREGSDPKMFSHQNGKFRAEHEQEQEQSPEALSPSSDTARVGPSSSSNAGTTTQSDKSGDMFSSNAVDTRPVQEDTPTQGASLHQEEQGGTFQSNTENGLEGNDNPSLSSSNSLGPDVSGYNEHQVKVGTPEVATEMHQEDNSNARSEGQQLMPFYGIKNNTWRTSESTTRKPSNQQRDNDHDNKNQKIVYFLKMAKGMPLLNSRKKVHNSDEGYRVGEHFKNTVANDVQGVDSTPQTGPEVNGRRRYPWQWQYRPRRPWRPRPRQRQRPRPSYRPQPSPYPSPSTGGGGGALGGSSVDTNVPQVGCFPVDHDHGDSDFEQEALNTHNKYRKTHGVPDMTLSRDLSNQAKAYAQKIANMGQLMHSSQAERGESVGENLAYACSTNGTPLTGESATKMWYDEVCKPGYNFVNGGFSSGTGHFTQVVWKDSIKLGIGQGKATQNGMQCIYAVGRYDIAGNMMGEFQDQVLRGNFNKAYCNNVKK